MHDTLSTRYTLMHDTSSTLFSKTEHLINSLYSNSRYLINSLYNNSRHLINSLYSNARRLIKPHQTFCKPHLINLLFCCSSSSVVPRFYLLVTMALSKLLYLQEKYVIVSKNVKFKGCYFLMIFNRP